MSDRNRARARNRSNFLAEMTGRVSPESAALAFSGLMARSEMLPEGCDDDCAICLETMKDPSKEVIRMPRCTGHAFHRACIEYMFTGTRLRSCPVCKHPYMPELGDQPDGTMVHRIVGESLAGYSCPTIVIEYHFPDGTLSDGTRYTGTDRVAYLPKNQEGDIALKYLIKAFRRRKLFLVGDSITTGRKNTVVWGSIHQKSAMRGGPENFGYPDPTYFQRLIEACQYNNVFID